MDRDRIIAAYIMANRRNGTLYTGATVDLARRVFEHREGARHGFTKTYGCVRLVWYEAFDLITAAFQRERTIKGCPRQWKINLIQSLNPEWHDLHDRLNI